MVIRVFMVIRVIGVERLKSFTNDYTPPSVVALK
jgi:hypothetical protein